MILVLAGAGKEGRGWREVEGRGGGGEDEGGMGIFGKGKK